MGGTAALASGGLNFGLQPVAQAAPASIAPATKVVWQSCMVNCGSRCPLRIHVQDGGTVRVETDNMGKENMAAPSSRMRARPLYSSARLQPRPIKVPMRRVGKRGAGEFERITWEQAYDTVADEFNRVKEYGNEAIYIHYATGTLGEPSPKPGPRSQPHRTFDELLWWLFQPLRHVQHRANRGGDAVHVRLRAQTTALTTSQTPSWSCFSGTIPRETRMSGGGIVYSMKEAKRRERRTHDSCRSALLGYRSSAGDEWVPIRPGTDAALVGAMAYVMITENLVDQEFLDKYCLGYDEEHMPEGYSGKLVYKAYILGTAQTKLPKTPRVGSGNHRHSGQQDHQLAREIAHGQTGVHRAGLGSPTSGERRRQRARDCNARDLDRQRRGPGRQHGRARRRVRHFGESIPDLEQIRSKHPSRSSCGPMQSNAVPK